MYLAKNEDADSRHNPKISALWDILTSLGSADKTIIFFNSKKYLTIVHHELTLAGFECDKMMGGKDMDWADRDQVMRRFRKGDQHILLATDLVSRGIDIPGLTLVVNFDVPFEKDHEGFYKAAKETYLHRIGRTGRFDTRGLAINLIKD